MRRFLLNFLACVCGLNFGLWVKNMYAGVSLFILLAIIYELVEGEI